MATVIVPIVSRDDTKKGVDSVQRRFRSLGAGIQQGLGLGAGLGIASAVATGVSALQAGIDAAADFETALTEIEARTELTEQGLDAVSEAALAMGRDTKFSATEAADGMLELITSGSSAEEAIATIPNVLNLAAAAGLELGHAADGVTDVMAQFGLGVDQAETVVNAFTQAAGSSSATAADLIDAMKNGGAVASGFGLDVEQTAAAMAVLAENGLKGAEAGTALKSFFLNATRGSKESEAALAALNTSFFNADGSARDFNTVIGEISEGLAGMTDEEANMVLKDLAGSYGQVAARALVASGGIDEMQETMASQRTAAEVADTQMQTWQATLDSFGSTMQTLAIKILLPFIQNVLQPMLKFLIDGVNAFNSWIDTEEAQMAIQGVVEKFAFLWETVKNVVSLIGAVLRGDWAAVFRIAIKTVVDWVNGIVGLLESAFKGILTFVQDILNSIIRLINDALQSLPDFVKDTVFNVTGGQIDIKKGVGLLQEVDIAGGFSLPRVALPAFAQAPAAGAGGTVVNVNVQASTLIGDPQAIATDINDLMRVGIIR